MTATETDLPKWAKSERARKAREAYQPPPVPVWVAAATSGPGNTAIGHTGQPAGCGAFEARLAVRAAIRAAAAEVWG